MKTQDTKTEETATLTITGLPDIDADGPFIPVVIERALTNVDIEWDAASQAALHLAARALLLACAMGRQNGDTMDMETMAGLIVAAFVGDGTAETPDTGEQGES